ncbi:polyprenyl diphosphate synthase [Rhodoferax sp.]|uniref:polyprenyl diphosphate synthase n=1 Tax=Rhodoferax sp. TaxID=50421 RepID=UPI0025E884A5|nr:polyprenyl diphosphate synthase [Rhodoferax sp.]
MATERKLDNLHVAIVMDGNGRWASKRFLPRLAGHKQGVDALKRIVRACPSRGVTELTVFAFSSENWNRPAEEVSGLMDLMVGALAREVSQLSAEGVKLRFLGERLNLSGKVNDILASAELETERNAALCLNVCFNYGGRWDIVQAANRLVSKGLPITEQSLGESMVTHPSPDPDLLIRTGGEFRISNFLLWQAAYSELLFSPKLWPDFTEVDLDAAIEDFSARERRFGKTSAQVA